MLTRALACVVCVTLVAAPLSAANSNTTPLHVDKRPSTAVTHHKTTTKHKHHQKKSAKQHHKKHHKPK